MIYKLICHLQIDNSTVFFFLAKVDNVVYFWINYFHHSHSTRCLWSVFPVFPQPSPLSLRMRCVPFFILLNKSIPIHQMDFQAVSWIKVIVVQLEFGLFHCHFHVKLEFIFFVETFSGRKKKIWKYVGLYMHTFGTKLWISYQQSSSATSIVWCFNFQFGLSSCT